MQGAHEFKTEIELFSRIHHKNVVSLVGFCYEQGKHMLVYEYRLNVTLRICLSGNSGFCLDYRKRLRIAFDVARGLSYLHELADPPIIHRDAILSIILLDKYLSAKFTDFRLSKLMGDTHKGYFTTQVNRTLFFHLCRASLVKLKRIFWHLICQHSKQPIRMLFLKISFNGIRQGLGR